MQSALSVITRAELWKSKEALYKMASPRKKRTVNSLSPSQRDFVYLYIYIRSRALFRRSVESNEKREESKRKDQVYSFFSHP